MFQNIKSTPINIPTNTYSPKSSSPPSIPPSIPSNPVFYQNNTSHLSSVHSINSNTSTPPITPSLTSNYISYNRCENTDETYSHSSLYSNESTPLLPKNPKYYNKCYYFHCFAYFLYTVANFISGIPNHNYYIIIVILNVIATSILLLKATYCDQILLAWISVFWMIGTLYANQN